MSEPFNIDVTSAEPQKINVTVEITPPTVDPKLLAQIVTKAIRDSGRSVQMYRSIEEALNHRGDSPRFCDACDEPALFGCPCGEHWCGVHKCPKGNNDDTAAPDDVGGDAVLPAANDLPRAATHPGGDLGGR